MIETARNLIPELVSQYLPETVEQSKLSKIRAMLGTAATELSDEQLETLTAQGEYLIDCWLDDYERQLFAGKTLQEMINAK